MPEALHGGRLWATARALGLDPANLLDFSANLNPLGPPGGVVALLRRADPALLAAYPDTDAPSLRKALVRRHHVPDPCLVLGSGGAALLFLALRALAPKRVLVPVPCFREQPRAVAACGAELASLPMQDLRLDLGRLEPRGCDAVLLTNPHNPTGQLLDREALLAWRRAHPDVALVVDEAFMDGVPGGSVLPEIVELPRTVVLRSLTKFYAMPALRVGHALADAATAERMRGLQEAWPVGQLELLAAEAALADEAYERATLAFLREEAPRFHGELVGLGLKVHPGAAPFRLVELPDGDGPGCAGRLLERGILVRTCADWPGLGVPFLRLALRGREDRRRLLEALSGEPAARRE